MFTWSFGLDIGLHTIVLEKCHDMLPSKEGIHMLSGKRPRHDVLDNCLHVLPIKRRPPHVVVEISLHILSGKSAYTCRQLKEGLHMLS